MEMLYQYLWKHRMMGREFVTVQGEPVVIVSPGRLNRDSGPDFSGARVRIGATEWTGNVEIHVKASDWRRHHHDSDPAYDSVILHVVSVSDTRIRRRDGSEIPQMVATFPESFFRMYARLADRIADVACDGLLGSLPPLVVTDWVSTLAVERMQMKASRILDTWRAVGCDWERACFIALARALGFGLSSDPVEQLARSVPLTVTMHHSDNPLQLEALLFGQAGMLDPSLHIFDEYYQTLCREYFFLARKYGLRPMRREVWKYSRTRPQNFPHRRIALLARALRGGFRMLALLLAEAARPGFDDDAVRPLLSLDLDGYWLSHSGFDTECRPGPKALSPASVSLLIINFVAPLLYSYGSAHGDPDLAEKGLDLWDLLPAESNAIVRRWAASGISCRRASESQAVIQLRKEYCDRDRCLDCRLGHALLRYCAAAPARMIMHEPDPK